MEFSLDRGEKACKKFVILTSIIQEHILWLEVSVYNPVLVQMLKSTDDLSRVKTSSGFIKAWIFLIHIIHVKSIV